MVIIENLFSLCDYKVGDLLIGLIGSDVSLSISIVLFLRNLLIDVFSFVNGL